MMEKFPNAKRFRMYGQGERKRNISGNGREPGGIIPVTYKKQEELEAWLEELTQEVEKAQPPAWFDSLDRYLYRICVDENLQKTDGAHFTEDAYWRLAAEVAKALASS